MGQGIRHQDGTSHIPQRGDQGSASGTFTSSGTGSGSGHNHSASGSFSGSAFTPTGTISTPTYSGSSLDTTNPYQVVNYIIKF